MKKAGWQWEWQNPHICVLGKAKKKQVEDCIDSKQAFKFVPRAKKKDGMCVAAAAVLVSVVSVMLANVLYGGFGRA